MEVAKTIFVTPAMIEAGIDEFWRHNLEDGACAAIVATLEAMARAGGLVVKQADNLLDLPGKG